LHPAPESGTCFVSPDHRQSLARQCVTGANHVFCGISASVVSSCIASSEKLALKAGKWIFRSVILNRVHHEPIHLDDWSEILPSLSRNGAAGEN